MLHSVSKRATFATMGSLGTAGDRQKTIYKFGLFQADSASGHLHRAGTRVKLQDLPFRILCLLLEQPGEVISREELRAQLWPPDTHVDFEGSFNVAIKRLRYALNDSAENPIFVETVPKRGYRFIAPVEVVSRAEAEPKRERTAVGEGAVEPAPLAARWRLSAWPLIAGCIAAVVALSAVYWLSHGRSVLSYSSNGPVLLADFENQTGEQRFDRALRTALTVTLEQSTRFNVYPQFQIENALRLMARKPGEPISAAIAREICQRENLHVLLVPGITRAGHQYLLTAQFIDPATGSTVRSYSESAADEDHILSALDSISTSIRRDLGESRYEIHQAHRPLPQVTTASLAALRDYVEGTDKFGNGDANESVRLIKNAIEKDPDFAIAHAALGYDYYSFYLNEPQLGEQEFQKALALKSRTTDREYSWIELRHAESQGRIGDTLHLYRDYLEHYPGDWVARYSYTRMLRMHGHAAESVAMYQQLLRESPNDPGTYIELATAYGDLQQWPQSIQCYEEAFAIDPRLLTTASFNREYGFTLLKGGEDAKSERIFSLLLTDPKSYSSGERSLAFLDLYRGRYADARQKFKLALAQTSDTFSRARIRYMLAVIADGQGNHREQIAQLDLIMANFDALPEKVIYGSLVGQAYARAGNVESARKVLDTIAPLVNERMEDQAGFAEILKAEVAAATGDFRSAQQFMRPPTSSDSEDVATPTSEMLAYIYQQAGKLDDAISWYEQFLSSQRALGWERQQEVFQAHYMLARDYQQKGDRARAMREVSQLLDLWKNADPNLTLLKKAHALRDELVAVPKS